MSDNWKTKTMWWVECDGDDCENEGPQSEYGPQAARQEARCEGWHVDGTKAYCKECLEALS